MTFEYRKQQKKMSDKIDASVEEVDCAVKAGLLAVPRAIEVLELSSASLRKSYDLTSFVRDDVFLAMQCSAQIFNASLWMCLSQSYCAVSFLMAFPIGLVFLVLLVKASVRHKEHSKSMYDGVAEIEAEMNALLEVARAEVLDRKLELL